MCKDIKKIIAEVNKKYLEVTNLAEKLAKEYIENQKYNTLTLSTETCVNKMDCITIVRIKEYNDLERLIKQEGFYIILCGKKEHPENIGTISYCGKNYSIVQNEKEVKEDHSLI